MIMEVREGSRGGCVHAYAVVDAPSLSYALMCSLPDYGAGDRSSLKFSVSSTNRLITMMVVMDILEEYATPNNNPHYPQDVYFLRPGPQAQVSRQQCNSVTGNITRQIAHAVAR